MIFKLFLFFRLGQELAKLGNQVTLIIPSNAKLTFDNNQPGFETLSFQSRYNESIFNAEKTQEMLYKYASSGSFYQYYMWYKKNARVYIENEGYDMIFDKEIMKNLKEKEIDFMILDFEPYRHLQVLTKLFNVPYAVYSLPFLPWRYGVARLPSSSSNLFLGYTRELTFMQRFLSLSFDLLFACLAQVGNEKDDFYFKVKKKYQIDLVSFASHYTNASLYFYLEDLTTGDPSATTPFCISVGEIMGRPSNALPKNLETFVTQKPTVLISFGSYIHALPQAQTDKFCNVFEKLKNFNFIWKIKNEAVCGRKIVNLMLRPWVPQNDLLSKVVLFVSHGGYNSFVEAVYQGTPLVVFPMIVDQQYQAEMAEIKNIGIKMNLFDWSESELIVNIMMLTSKESAYKKSANRWSSIMKDRPITAAQKVSHAINHVIKFGDKHLKDNSTQLYWFQYFMFDVFLAYILIAFSIFVSTYLIVRLIFRKIFRLSFIEKLFRKQKKL